MSNPGIIGVDARDAASSLVGNSAEAQQFFNRLLTVPSVARETVIATFIDALVAAGIWALLDCLYLFAAADQGTALTNLVNGNTRAAWPVGSGTFTVDRGLLPLGGSNYLNTRFIPASGTNFLQNSASLFAWNRTATTQPGYMIGTAHVHLSPYLANAHSQWAINSASEDDAGAVAPDASGFWLANRTSASAATLSRNGEVLQSSTTASTSRDATAIEAASNNTCQLACFGAGGGLDGTQRSALYTIFQVYMTSVGAG